ncbi:MAG: hypothetical protein WA634_01765 [Silvibacterium sp.]
MAATPSPNPDRFDPLNQRELSRLIQAAFGDEGIDGFEADAGHIYSTELMRPLVCALAVEALSGGWLGKTQWEISEKLTKIKDRAWLSRARYQGRISLCLFLRLWFHRDRPKDSTVTEERLRPEMNRSAAIGIARAIAKLLPTNWQLEPEFLSELNYELGCFVVAATSAWAAVHKSGNIDGAVRIIKEVCDGNERNVIPGWYTETQRRHTASEITRLTNDGNAAFHRLDHLSRHWRGVLIATSELLESIWSREAKDVA